MILFFLILRYNLNIDFKGDKMGKLFLDFQNVSFAYDSMSTSLFESIHFHIESGWTGIVGINGCGKSTLLKLALKVLKPSSGTIQGPMHYLYCEQRTDDCPNGLQEMLESYDRHSYDLIDSLQIQPDWINRWDTLSHGERKRVQIGVALWKKPDLLAIDEPTNHIDFEARQLLMNALKNYRGIGLIVSHDKMVLETLCNQNIFIDPPNLMLRKGAISNSLKEILNEENQSQHIYEKTKKELKKLKKISAGHRNDACRANQKRSKKGVDKKDHDTKAKIDAARVTGKDGTAGKLLNQLKGKTQQVQKRLSEIKIKKNYHHEVWLEGEYSKKDHLFSIPEQKILLGGKRNLTISRLQMKPKDRIAITGANGLGKSTLIQTILSSLLLPKDRVIYLPQELSIKKSRELIKEATTLPKDQLGKMMTIVNCLGSRPPRLLESELPSPGEVRKILLAMGIIRSPHLIIMDEPTNHLDLISIQCLEEILTHCPCGVLLVSHDQAFLDKTTDINWKIDRKKHAVDHSLLTVFN